MGIRVFSERVWRGTILASTLLCSLALASCVTVVKSETGSSGSSGSSGTFGTITITADVPVGRGMTGCTGSFKGSAILDDGYTGSGTTPPPPVKRSRAPVTAPDPVIGISLVSSSNQGVHTRIPSDSANDKPLVIPTFSAGQQFLAANITSDNRLFVRAKEILLISAEVFDAALRNGTGSRYTTCPATFQVRLANSPDSSIIIPGPQLLTSSLTQDERKAMTLARAKLYIQADQVITASQGTYITALAASPAK